MYSRNNKVITYDNNYPTKIGDKVTIFTNGKLTKYDSTSFTYDGYGRRLTKNNINYFYDSNNRLIKQYDDSSYIEFIYIQNQLIGLNVNGTHYLYGRNILGDITHILSLDGEIVARYDYDAWGNHIVSNLTPSNIGDINPFRYRGYYYDVETRLFWLSSRYYSPELCRFISPDDVSYLDSTSINGLNLYAYCMNNPIMYADPSGHWIETVFDLISLGASVVEVVINPTNPWAWAGLVGDAVDLLPFVTGLGEGIRATKMVKYADDVIDASYDTIKFVKAADMVDDFSDGGTMLRRVGNLDDYRTLTKTTHVDGTNLHTLFMDNGDIIVDSITQKKYRYDGINKLTKSLYELKPYNRHSARRGVKQIIKYNDILGGGYKMIIVLY